MGYVGSNPTPPTNIKTTPRGGFDDMGVNCELISWINQKLAHVSQFLFSKILGVKCLTMWNSGVS